MRIEQWADETVACILRTEDGSSDGGVVVEVVVQLFVFSFLSTSA